MFALCRSYWRLLYRNSDIRIRLPPHTYGTTVLARHYATKREERVLVFMLTPDRETVDSSQADPELHRDSKYSAGPSTGRRTTVITVPVLLC